jgi:hypothetical protein
MIVTETFLKTMSRLEIIVWEKETLDKIIKLEKSRKISYEIAPKYVQNKNNIYIFWLSFMET